MDAAEVIAKALNEAAPRAKVDDLIAAETALVGQATGSDVPGGIAVPADLIAGQARLWRDTLDPDGIEPRAETAFQRREFWVCRKAENDLVGFGGRITVDVAAKLHAVFDAILTPRTAPQCVPDAPDTPDAQNGLEVNTVGDGVGDQDGPRGRQKDTRTPGQQRADVFAAMIDSLARSGDLPTMEGAAPTVLVTLSSNTLD